MMTSGPPKYGSTPEEREISDLIFHHRKTFPGSKRKSFREIADILNAQALFPRIALRWTPTLVFNVHKKGMSGVSRNETK